MKDPFDQSRSIYGIKKALNRVTDSFKADNIERVWRVDVQKLPFWERLRLRSFRMLYLLVSGLQEDQLRLRASALTFSTLMSLVPLLALGLSVLKGMGFDLKLASLLSNMTSDMPVEFQEFVNQITDIVANTNFAKLGGVGGLLLVMMVVQMLSRIEDSFNGLWGVSQARGWFHRVSNYVSIVIVVPMLVFAAMGLTAKFALTERVELTSWVIWPVLILAFAFLYKVMPNCVVKVGPALAGGLVAAVLWQLWFRTYIGIQPGVTRYNLLYGTLASVPIFLAWLYVSWLIVLLGSKAAYAVQHEKGYHHNLLDKSASCRTETACAVSLLLAAAHHYEEGLGPLKHGDFFAKASYGSGIGDRVMDKLAVAGWLQIGVEEETLVLTTSLKNIKVWDVFRLFWGEEEEEEGAGEAFFSEWEDSQKHGVMALNLEDLRKMRGIEEEGERKAEQKEEIG